MNKRTLILIARICGVVAIGSVLLYIWKFSSHGLSGKTDDWANFGGYLGGILSALIGIINVAVLIYISLLISKHDDRRWSYQLIYEAYSDLINKLNLLNFSEYDPVKAHELQLYIYSFTYNNKYLFDKHEKYFSNLCYDFGGTISGIEVSASNYLSKSEKALDLNRLRNRGLIGYRMDSEEQIQLEILSFQMTRFETYRHHLLSFIKQYIMNKDVDLLVKIDLKKLAKDNSIEWDRTQKEFLSQRAINIDDWI